MGLRPAKSHEKLGGDADWPDGGADPLVRAGRPRPAAGPTISAPCRAAAGRRGRGPPPPPSPEGVVFRPCRARARSSRLVDRRQKTIICPTQARTFAVFHQTSDVQSKRRPSSLTFISD